jgi:pilus assembly protein CpaE
MIMNYYILSEQKMYSTAIKMMLDELHKRSKIFDTPHELKKELEDSKATVVIIGPTNDPYDICQRFTRHFPLTAVVLLLNQEDVDYKKAMYAGAVDVIDIESDEKEVIESIEKAEQVVSLKRANEQGVNGEKNGKVISVCSTKGGVGKSTLCVNMAVSLSLHTFKVAVIDLDLQFGDIALLLDKQPNQTIYDWVKQSYENGDKSINGYMTHHKLGIDIMAAPALLEFAELIKEEHVAYLLEEMKKEYDIILIDTPPAFVDTSVAAYEHSDIILLIATSDLPAIKNGKVAIETLKLLELEDRISIILNRDSNSDGIPHDLVEGVLGMTLNAVIPSDFRTVISSVNRGEAFVTTAPKTPVAKAIVNLSEELIKQLLVEKNITREKWKSIKEKRRGLLSLKRRIKE